MNGLPGVDGQPGSRYYILSVDFLSRRNSNNLQFTPPRSLGNSDNFIFPYDSNKFTGFGVTFIDTVDSTNYKIYYNGRYNEAINGAHKLKRIRLLLLSQALLIIIQGMLSVIHSFMVY